MNQEVYQEIYRELTDQRNAFERIGVLLQKVPADEVLFRLEKMEAALEFFINRMVFAFRNDSACACDAFNELLKSAGNWENIRFLSQESDIKKYLDEYFIDIAEKFCVVIDKVESIEKNNDRMGLVLISKNEGRYLPEWIEYHKAVGISRFFIYDNESDDSTRDILQQYIDDGSVTYIWCPGKRMQLQAYSNALDRFRFEVKYMGFIDADEFILPLKGTSVPDIVEKIFEGHSGAGGISVNWRVFGSGGVLKDEGKPVISTFIHRAEDSFWQHQHFKSICDPRKTLYPLSPHHFSYADNYCVVNERGTVLTESYDMSGVGQECSFLQLNHYYVKSKEYWDNVKMKRGFADTVGGYTDKYFEMNDRNEVEDKRILKFLPLVEEQLKNRGFLL